LQCKENDEGAAEAAFLAAEHGPPSSTQQREGAQSRIREFFNGLLAQ